jgi:hypothetical protein
MFDVDQLTALLERGMHDAAQLRDDELAAVLHTLTEPTGRDAAIAVLTGHRQDAARLARSLAPATHWFTRGPLDAASVDQALPLLHRLAAEAAGGPSASTIAAMLAYLDWANNHPVRAAARLTHCADDPLGRLLQRMIAAGVRGPRIDANASGPRR